MYIGTILFIIDIIYYLTLFVQKLVEFIRKKYKNSNN